MILTKGFLSKIAIFLFFLSQVNTVFAQNPPVATDNVDTVDFNTTLTVVGFPTDGLLLNDTDVDGDVLTVTEFIIDGVVGVFNAGDTVVIPGIGTITINADGGYEFIPIVGYQGLVPNITYTITDGTDTSSALLLLTVEFNDDLLEITSFSSCNQGFTASGMYKIRYQITLTNKSIAREGHTGSLVSNIDLKDDLASAFGTGCVVSVGNPTGPPSPLITISTLPLSDYFGNPYPSDWDPIPTSPINSNFEALNSTTIFNANAIATNVLYPGQSLGFVFCVIVDPSCVLSDPINFDNVITVTSQSTNGVNGNSTQNLEITDFHTSETTVAANLFVPDIVSGISAPDVEPDGTYVYTNTVTIINDGNLRADNVNFNLGLGNFIDNGITFTSINISQISGPTVNINLSYDGDINSLLLTNANNLEAGEVVVLEIDFIVSPLASSSNESIFSQLNTSMTQGTADNQGTTPGLGIDEFSITNRRLYSYVIWSDTAGGGAHLDRYYVPTSVSDIPSSENQCLCDRVGMRFEYNFDLDINKEITSVSPAISGIPEHKAITFRLTIKNTSTFIQVSDLQIQDNLNTICSGNIISVSSPIISSSTATTNPILNASFDGISDINIFDGSSGVLDPNENVVIEFTVVISDDCIGVNTASFFANDPLGIISNGTSGTVDVSVFSDTDNDGISNVNDIDDDNDGIPDLLEYNGIDPLADADGDFIPNYRDTNSGANPDANGDGIVDAFDFDFDGIPNHFDLDSDNDGITDIVEAGGIDSDNDGRVPINTDGTLTIDADNDGLTDDFVVDTDADGIADQPVDIDAVGGVLIPTPNTDTTGNPDYLDIDSDGDGIVDNIEVQQTTTYDDPNVSSDINGLVYSAGITPIDTDLDNQPDYLDTNSDNDARDDIIEGWDTNNDGVAETNVVVPNDSDNDGLDDAFDIVINDGSQVNSANNQTPQSFPNEDIPITDERDWREIKAPLLTIVDAEEDEGDALQFAVFLDKVSQNDIVIEFTVEDIETTVTNDYDFATPIITYTISAGTGLIADNLSFDINTINDSLNELNLETFILKADVVSQNTENLNLSNIGGIRDLDPVPLLLINNPTVVEGNKLEFVLSLVDPLDETRFIADYRPINLNMFTTNVTARQPEDYLPISTAIIIPAESITTVVDIFTIDDNLVELTETMTLTGIINPLITANTDVRIEGIGTILDNDLPNLFSPNNDGLSDFFEIIALLNFPDFKLQIFDRWGSEVYNYSNQGNPIPVWWDGNYKGNPAPEGVYYYTLDYNDGLTKPKSGFVQLIR